jgi:hypothetical protein
MFEGNVKSAIFMVDQFESTFTNPDVFQAYESLASLIIGMDLKLFMLVARKNDQLTTYDDSKISLERLNSLSISYELIDFITQEAAELIDNINKSAAKPVGKDVLSYVHEFAQGFPWLIKRTMAHIIKLCNAGVSQRELFAVGLRLDDLFDEELEELDEIEKDYLTKIVQRLPADYNQLQRQFDEDPLLPKILDKLTRSRLLRMTGATYDTYNDVFKEYLVYRKLPEFRQAIIYRMSPNTVLTAFHDVINMDSFNLDNLKHKLDLSKGSAFNLIREFRNLNFIRKDGVNWKIHQSVIDVYNQGKLGEYIRRQLADNNIIGNLLNKAAKGVPQEVNQLASYLHDQFPFIEASDQTWNLYSTILKSWINITRLLDVSDEHTLVLPKEDRSKALEDLGNLANISSSTRRLSPEVFFPTIQIQTVCFVANILLNDGWPSTKQDNKALIDLKNGGWLSGKQLLFTTIDEFREQTTFMFNTEPYERIWNSVNDPASLIELVKDLLGDNTKPSTLKWRIKILLNWGKELGLIPNKRYKYAIK